MKVQVTKGFACRDSSGRMVHPVIGDIIDLPQVDALRLAERGSVVIIEEVKEPESKPAKKKVL